MECKPNNEDIGYDPAHVAAMIVIVIFVLNVLFWLLWSLLVFKGGIITKAVMFVKVIMGGGSFAAIDSGLWDGWIINLGALGVLLFFIGGIFFILKRRKEKN